MNVLLTARQLDRLRELPPGPQGPHGARRLTNPLIPRETLRWRGLYKRRGAVEREFGRLKNEWAMAPLRVRRLERVSLHVDLTVLAKLACRLASERTLAAAA